MDISEQKLFLDKFRKNIKNYALVGVVAGAVLLGGCDNSAKNLELARTNGVIVYQNGFMSDEARKMTKKLANSLGMAHVSTDSRYLEMMDVGEESKYGNHIVFHSAGSDSAYNFSVWCAKRDIDIRSVSSLEAFTQKTFPNNVEKIINYSAPGQWIFGEHNSLGGKTNRPVRIPNSDHLNLPWKSKSDIKRRIVNSQRNPVYRNIPKRSGKRF